RGRSFVFKHLACDCAEPHHAVLFSSTTGVRIRAQAGKRYKYRAVADEVEKPPLVEDRNFLASLDDLDRGLEYEGQPFIERRRRPRPPRPVAPPISPPPAIDRAPVQPPPRPQPPTATAALSPPPSSLAAPAPTPMPAAPGRRPP